VVLVYAVGLVRVCFVGFCVVVLVFNLLLVSILVLVLVLVIGQGLLVVVWYLTRYWLVYVLFCLGNYFSLVKV